MNFRFSHSEYSEDFGSMFGYQFSSGFNEHVGSMVHRRGEVLMESGIFWMWKKWENLRWDFNNRKVPGEKAFVELSFDNSDVHLVFGVYFSGVLVAVLPMGIEILRYRRALKSLIKKLRHEDQQTEKTRSMSSSHSRSMKFCNKFGNQSV